MAPQPERMADVLVGQAGDLARPAMTSIQPVNALGRHTPQLARTALASHRLDDPR